MHEGHKLAQLLSLLELLPVDEVQPKKKKFLIILCMHLVCMILINYDFVVGMF